MEFLRRKAHTYALFSYVEKRTAVLFLPLVVWLVSFQFAGKIPNEYRPDVSVVVLPSIDEYFFGNHFVVRYLPEHDFLTVILALPYLCHFAIPWVFCVYLLFHRRSPFPFLFTIGLLNLVAVCTQLMWPTAPPWWVEKHGPEVPSYDVPSNAGRLLRIDELMGVDLFRGMYGANPVVFGSFPSLHSAWPLLIALYAVYPLAPRYRFLYPAWVWVAAIYLKHHFVVDVVFGILYTLGAAWVSARLVNYLYPGTPTLYGFIMIESVERDASTGYRGAVGKEGDALLAAGGAVGDGLSSAVGALGDGNMVSPKSSKSGSGGSGISSVIPELLEVISPSIGEMDKFSELDKES
mmetsp:Transcript_9939/g.30588  ORF Transcript_9939/g.30588 Transcript_9939/m.30588 type:complete len:349 (-) Transcript_9939:140-1186(-)